MAAPMESAFENYIIGFDDSAAVQLSKNLIDKEISLTDVLENLGVYLTNKETSTRARATKLIADILHNLPQDFLTQAQVSVLGVYLCERLKDHHSLQAPAIYGLVYISQSPHVSGEVIETICRTIFTEVHTQSLPQADRRSVFNILLHFLNTRLKDVEKIAGDFVYGFIQTMDAEKDPRNLVLAFNCALRIIHNFPLGVFVEEMFEVVSCYFPIDFTPSPNDPSGIKKDDLVLSLRQCMAASPQFAQYCLPLLVEKLTSDLKSAKIDALETLAVCAPAYGATSLHEFQTTFFNCIKKEMFLYGDPVVDEAGLHALRSIVTTLSTGVTQGDTKKSSDGFLNEILTECKNHLLQPELMLMLSSGRLLQAAALGSDPACCQIVRTVIPQLVDTYNKQTLPTPRHNVITVINGFLECTAAFSYTKDNPNPMLHTNKDEVLGVYIHALGSGQPSLQILGVQGLYSLVCLPPSSLLDTERSYIATQILHILLQPHSDHILRTKCCTVLEYLLSNFTDSIQSHVLPVMFSRLKHEPMEDSDGDSVSIPQILEILSAITHGADTVKLVLDVLCHMLWNIDNLDVYRALTQCLADISTKCAMDEGSRDILCHVGVKSIHKLAEEKHKDIQWRARLVDDTVLTHLSTFIRHVSIHCSYQMSLEIQVTFITLFLNNDNKIPENIDLSVGLMTPAIGCLSPKDDIIRESEIFPVLIQLCCLPQPARTVTYVCKCLAVIVNKHKENEDMTRVLGDFKQSLVDKLVPTSSTEEPAQCVVALAWITKALVLRNHKLARPYIEELINLLSCADLGPVAKAFSILVTEYPDVLNKQTRANIRLMYRQRLFVENSPKIIQGYNAASQETKPSYLMALSYLIQGLPQQVLTPEMPTLYPLLIQSLLCDNLDLQLATMETLADLIHNAPTVVDKQIDSLVPRLIQMTKYQQAMKMRIASLKCITGLTSLPLHVILPYRNKITRALIPVLDDKKRLVRVQAAASRHEWFMLEVDKS